MEKLVVGGQGNYFQGAVYEHVVHELLLLQIKQKLADLELEFRVGYEGFLQVSEIHQVIVRGIFLVEMLVFLFVEDHRIIDLLHEKLLERERLVVSLLFLPLFPILFFGENFISLLSFVHRVEERKPRVVEGDLLKVLGMVVVAGKESLVGFAEVVYVWSEFEENSVKFLLFLPENLQLLPRNLSESTAFFIHPVGIADDVLEVANPRKQLLELFGLFLGQFLELLDCIKDFLVLLKRREGNRVRGNVRRELFGEEGLGPLELGYLEGNLVAVNFVENGNDDLFDLHRQHLLPGLEGHAQLHVSLKQLPVAVFLDPDLDLSVEEVFAGEDRVFVLAQFQGDGLQGLGVVLFHVLHQQKLVVVEVAHQVVLLLH